jgi:crossover junction endodeoxyribonuclease RuvC
VKVLLPRAELNTTDSTDALAIAICHAHHRSTQTLAKILARS